MPELPEVEHLRRTLLRVLPGRRVVEARLVRADVGSAHDGTTPSARDLLAGGRITRLIRHGKQLAIAAEDGRAVRVHLGMTGQLLVLAAGEAPRRADHVHARWRLDDGSTMLFRDPRRFGGLATYPSLEALRVAEWARLGPDALTITGQRLGAVLAGSRRPVKAVLLDQGVLAGVGNIYADESLFRAGLHPRLSAHRVVGPAADRLARAIRLTLSQALGRGGSSVRDYVDGTGRPGRFQHLHRVYGRAGAPCLTCGRPLAASVVAQRTTVFCRRCQRRSVRAADYPQLRARLGAAPACASASAGVCAPMLGVPSYPVKRENQEAVAGGLVPCG